MSINKDQVFYEKGTTTASQHHGITSDLDKLQNTELHTLVQ